MRVARGLLDFDRQSPATMPLDTAERLYLDRQVTLARAIFVALALVDLIEMSAAGSRTAAAIFLAVYLLLALAVLGYERMSSETNFSDSAGGGLRGTRGISLSDAVGFRLVVSVSVRGVSRWLRRAIRARCWRW